MSKSTAPNLETAISGFQQMIEVMKTQKASWMNYVNLQNSGDFDIIKILTSAFFMQAIANKQEFINYRDSVKIDTKKLFSSLESNRAILLYETLDLITSDMQRLYLIGADTAFFIRGDSYFEQYNVVRHIVQVLTFDRALFENSIKQMLSSI